MRDFLCLVEICEHCYMDLDIYHLNIILRKVILQPDSLISKEKKVTKRFVDSEYEKGYPDGDSHVILLVVLLILVVLYVVFHFFPEVMFSEY